MQQYESYVLDVCTQVQTMVVARTRSPFIGLVIDVVANIYV